MAPPHSTIGSLHADLKCVEGILEALPRKSLKPQAKVAIVYSNQQKGTGNTGLESKNPVLLTTMKKVSTFILSAVGDLLCSIICTIQNYKALKTHKDQTTARQSLQDLSPTRLCIWPCHQCIPRSYIRYKCTILRLVARMTSTLSCPIKRRKIFNGVLKVLKGRENSGSTANVYSKTWL